MPDQLEHLTARELRKLEIFAVEATDALDKAGQPPVPDTPTQLREKKQAMADKEAVIKGRGYAIPGEV